MTLFFTAIFTTLRSYSKHTQVQNLALAYRVGDPSRSPVSELTCLRAIDLGAESMITMLRPLIPRYWRADHRSIAPKLIIVRIHSLSESGSVPAPTSKNPNTCHESPIRYLGLVDTAVCLPQISSDFVLVESLCRQLMQQFLGLCSAFSAAVPVSARLDVKWCDTIPW